MPIAFENPVSRFHREPPPFSVSRIRRTHSLWRYLWPYRSANHFSLTMCSNIAIWTLHGIFLAQFIPYYFHPLGLLALIFLATVTIPYDELPAKVTITTTVPAHRFLDEIVQEMVESGYVVQTSTSDQPDDVHFSPQKKVEFWPLLWIEQDVNAYLRDANTIEVDGSKVDLSKLVHCLKRRYKKLRRVAA
ncbi:MAG TPA: hypothetical protein VF800_24420 [Telluria sp.]